jgi:hypothetical protein
LLTILKKTIAIAIAIIGQKTIAIAIPILVFKSIAIPIPILVAIPGRQWLSSYVLYQSTIKVLAVFIKTSNIKL